VDLPDVVFEQWLSLTGRVAQIRYRMTYTGERAHASRDHEIPAVFVEPDLDTLVLYDGDKPWMGGALSRSQPGWPNESRRMTEHWAAYVDKTTLGWVRSWRLQPISPVIAMPLGAAALKAHVPISRL
jgi:hypothetical protein